jgi:radical SAM superfamily enzyme YgiQ (UPF0313 family)
MKVLLVVKSKMMENLGVMYLSAVIKKAGHECRIENISYAEYVATYWKPDIIGLSIMTGDQERFKAFHRNLKHKTTVIVGGHHPSFFPEDCDWADMVITGEAEQAIAGLLQSDLMFPDIHSLPWPDRSDFKGFKIRDFISSRGCPQKCTYCYNGKWAKLFPEYKGVRTRTVQDLIGELKWCKNNLQMKYVYYQDSCFGVNINWMREYAKEYKTHIYLPYQCNFRPEQITPERVALLHDSNCVAIRMALETASDRLRKMVGRKGYKLSDVSNASGLLRERNIMFMLQNILGLPSATIEDDLNTLEFNILCQPTYAWASIYQPYPGTKLGDLCKKEGWYKGDYSDITDSFFDTSFLEIPKEHKEQLEVLQKIFALCVEHKYLPLMDELRYSELPKLIHKITRKTGDKKLYLNLL